MLASALFPSLSLGFVRLFPVRLSARARQLRYSSRFRIARNVSPCRSFVNHHSTFRVSGQLSLRFLRSLRPTSQPNTPRRLLTTAYGLTAFTRWPGTPSYEGNARAREYETGQRASTSEPAPLAPELLKTNRWALRAHSARIIFVIPSELESATFFFA